jgi:hypothetical protein
VEALLLKTTIYYLPFQEAATPLLAIVKISRKNASEIVGAALART